MKCIYNQPRTHRILTSLVVLAGFVTLTGCLFQPSIPVTALKDADPSSATITWSAALARSGGTLTVFAVTLSNGERAYRAFIRLEGKEVYLGQFQSQLADAPLHTLFFQVGKDRFVIGRVADTVSGTLAFVDIQRYTQDRTNWVEAMRQSTVKDRIFFMHLTDGQGDPWDSVAYIAIQSRESLALVTQGMGAKRNEWEATFDPPIDISALYVIAQ